MGNSQPIQIAKDAKIKRYTVRNALSEEQAEGVAVKIFCQYFKKIRRSQYSVTQGAL